MDYSEFKELYQFEVVKTLTDGYDVVILMKSEKTPLAIQYQELFGEVNIKLISGGVVHATLLSTLDDFSSWDGIIADYREPDFIEDGIEPFNPFI